MVANKGQLPVKYGSCIRLLWKNMGEKYLTPLNVQEELIHSYFLSFVYIIVLNFKRA